MAQTDSLKTAVQHLVELGPEIRERLLLELEKTSPELTLLNLVQKVSRSIPVPTEKLRDILVPFAGWYPIANKDNRDDIARFILTKLYDARDAAPEDLSPIICRLLTCDSIGITDKAHEIKWRNDCNFKRVDVTTDIRPVFSSNPNDQPKYAVVVHQLRMTIARGEPEFENSIFVGLDKAQLEQIHEVVTRALKKEEILTSQSLYHYLEEE